MFELWLFSSLYWACAVASLIGIWFNIRRQVACFWVWAVTNAVWAYADLTHGLLPQACLQLVYLGFSIYGIVRWTEERHGEEAAG